MDVIIVQFYKLLETEVNLQVIMVNFHELEQLK